jgi:hypothetical protein
MLIVAAYLVPLLAGIFFWTVIGASKWRRSGAWWPPLSSRLLGALVQSCGPIAWLDVPVTLPTVAVICAGVWSAWILIVIRTRLAAHPLAVHITLGFLWCFVGCARVSLWV